MKVVRVTDKGASGRDARADRTAIQAAIEVSRDPEDYPNPALPALLEAHGAEEVSVTGAGTIRGRAMDFMERDLGYIYEPKPFRPRLLCFSDCRRVLLRGLEFHDAPSWTVHLIGCDGVDILGITIENNLAVPNCDGIDPDHCRNVRIRGCRITCADDAIVLKNSGEFTAQGPSENIEVSDCTLMCTAGGNQAGHRHGHGLPEPHLQRLHDPKLQPRPRDPAPRPGEHRERHILRLPDRDTAVRGTLLGTRGADSHLRRAPYLGPAGWKSLALES